MSDALDSTTHYTAPLPKPLVDDILDEATPKPQREGLPRTYRMRADQHYVDQLNAPPAGQLVRMIPTTQIDAEPTEHGGLRPLIESIRKLGIVHPLLVRHAGARYVLVAGHKRWTVARTLLLSAVPCLVHDVDDEQAAALAAADGLNLASYGGPAGGNELAPRIRAMAARHLAKARECMNVVADGEPWMARSVFDLIRAHTWRAASLIDMLDLVAGQPAAADAGRGVQEIVADVAGGFRAEAKLRAVAIHHTRAGDVRITGVSNRDIAAGLSGALFAMLPIVEQAPGATLSIHVDCSGADSIVMDIAQSVVPIAQLLAEHFFDEAVATAMLGDRPAGIGVLAVKALAQQAGGHAAMTPAEGGSRLRITLPLAS